MRAIQLDKLASENAIGSPRLQNLTTFALLLFIFVGQTASLDYLGPSSSELAKGNLVNQIAWIAFAVAYLPGVVRNRELTVKLIRSAIFLLGFLLWSLLSVTWAEFPEIAFRRVALIFVVTFVACGVAINVRSISGFITILVNATGLIMVANVLLYFIVPHISFDASGNFVGLHGHKNTAGVFAAISCLVWLAAGLKSPRTLYRLKMWSGSLAWGFVLLITHSVSSLLVVGLVGILTAFYFVCSMIGRLGDYYFVLILGFVSLFSSFMFGMFGDEGTFGIIFGNPTLSGRIYVWEFLGSEISQRPILGAGFGSFWDVGMAGPATTRGQGFVAQAGQGHNGYLDLVLTVGFVGFVLAVLAVAHALIALRKVVQWCRWNRIGYRGFVVVFFIIFATIIHNLVESSIFRGGHALWMVTLILMMYTHFFLILLSEKGRRVRIWDVSRREF